MFCRYQASEMGSLEWRALGHFFDAIRGINDLKYVYAWLIESSHNRYKCASCMVFERAGCAMIEAIEKHNKENSKYTQSQQKPASFWKISSTITNAKENDKSCLVKVGPATTIGRVIRFLQHHGSGPHDLNTSNALTGFEQCLNQRLH